MLGCQMKPMILTKSLATENHVTLETFHPKVAFKRKL